jgi:hypothetical protein
MERLVREQPDLKTTMWQFVAFTALREAFPLQVIPAPSRLRVGYGLAGQGSENYFLDEHSATAARRNIRHDPTAPFLRGIRGTGRPHEISRCAGVSRQVHGMWNGLPVTDREGKLAAMFRTALVAAALAWAGAAQGQTIEPLLDLLKFLDSLPAWTRSVDFPITPRLTVWSQQECPKDPHPLWPCPVQPHSVNPEFFGGWFLDTWVSVRGSESLTERLARESKPLTDRIIWQQARPKTVIRDDEGGVIQEYVGRWVAISSQGGPVEVLGICGSACTLVTSYVPKDRLCFGRDALLMFHMARFSDGPPSSEATKWMINSYPNEIRDWLIAQGGFEKIPYVSYLKLPANELWKMGYRKCGD